MTQEQKPLPQSIFDAMVSEQTTMEEANELFQEVSALTRENQRLKRKGDHFDRLMEIARERGEKARGFWSRNDKDPNYVHDLLNHYDREMATVIQNAERFRDKVLAWIRAFELSLTMVDGAYTHQEKGARLRGLQDLTSEAIARIDSDYKDIFHYDWFPESLFGTARDKARLQRRVWELEEAIETLKNPQPDDTTDDEIVF